VLSLVVLRLFDIPLMTNTSLEEVTILSLRWVTDHDISFVVLILLQRDGSDFPVVALDLVCMIGWIVLTPLWSRWLNIGFTSSFGTNPSVDSFAH
jgi:hypothetical protein